MSFCESMIIVHIDLYNQICNPPNQAVLENISNSQLTHTVLWNAIMLTCIWIWIVSRQGSVLEHHTDEVEDLYRTQISHILPSISGQQSLLAELFCGGFGFRN